MGISLPGRSQSRSWSPQWRLERALADELSDHLLEHDRLLIAVATAFGAATPPRQLCEWRDDAARPLFNVPTSGLGERAALLPTLMTHRLGFAACPKG